MQITMQCISTGNRGGNVSVLATEVEMDADNYAVYQYWQQRWKWMQITMQCISTSCIDALHSYLHPSPPLLSVLIHCIVICIHLHLCCQY